MSGPDYREQALKLFPHVCGRCARVFSGARLRELLAPHCDGSCPVSIVYSNHGAMCEIDLGEKWQVALHDELIRALGEWLKPENVSIVYATRA